MFVCLGMGFVLVLLLFKRWNKKPAKKPAARLFLPVTDTRAAHLNEKTNHSCTPKINLPTVDIKKSHAICFCCLGSRSFFFRLSFLLLLSFGFLGSYGVIAMLCCDPTPWWKNTTITHTHAFSYENERRNDDVCKSSTWLRWIRRSFFYEILPFGEFQLPPTLLSMADVASAPLLAARSD